MFIETGFTTKVDGGHRANKNAVFLEMFRKRRGRIFWAPALNDNLTFFYGDKTTPEFQKAYERILRNIKNQQRFIEVSFFDFQKEDSIVSIDDLPKNINYYQLQNTDFVDLLNSLKNVVDEIKRNTSLLEPRVLEAPNRKVAIAFLYLSEREIDLLQDEELISILINLLSRSYNERFYICLMVESVENFPLDLFSVLSWAVFLGEDNRQFAESLYGIPVGSIDITQKDVGVFYDENMSYLSYVYAIGQNHSQWLIDKMNQLEKEDKLYKEFLDSLDDGLEG